MPFNGLIMKIRPISTMYEKSLQNMIFASLKWDFLPPDYEKVRRTSKNSNFLKGFLIQPRYKKVNL